MAKKIKKSSRIPLVLCFVILGVGLIVFGLVYGAFTQRASLKKSDVGQTDNLSILAVDRIIYEKVKILPLENESMFWQSSLDGKQREVIPSITQTRGFSIPINDPVAVVATKEDLVVLAGNQISTVSLPNKPTPDSASDLFYAVSPDGKKIAYNKGSVGDNNTIMLMNIDGSDQQVLFDNSVSGFPLRPEAKHGQDGSLVPIRWSSDSQKIFFRNSCGCELMENQLASFDLQTKKFTLEKVSKYANFLPSPSGKLIAYQEYDEKWDKDIGRFYGEPKQPPVLIVEDISTKRKQKIPLKGNISLAAWYPAAWSPDSQALAVASNFIEGRATGISVITLKTGNVEVITPQSNSEVARYYEILYWGRNNQLFVLQNVGKEFLRSPLEVSLFAIDPFTKKKTLIDVSPEGEHIRMYGIVRAEK